MLLLATFGVHSDQLQPLLLDVLPAGDVVKVFLLKIQGVWRGEWREGAEDGLEATSAVPVSLGELAHFVGLVGPRESSWAFPSQHPRVTSWTWWCHHCDPSPALLGLPIKVWSYSVVGTAPALLNKGGDLPKALCLFQEHSQAEPSTDYFSQPGDFEDKGVPSCPTFLLVPAVTWCLSRHHLLSFSPA